MSNPPPIHLKGKYSASIGGEVLNRYSQAVLAALMTASGATEKPVFFIPIDYPNELQGLVLGINLKGDIPPEVDEALSNLVTALQSHGGSEA